MDYHGLSYGFPYSYIIYRLNILKCGSICASFLNLERPIPGMVAAQLWCSWCNPFLVNGCWLDRVSFLSWQLHVLDRLYIRIRNSFCLSLFIFTVGTLCKNAVNILFHSSTLGCFCWHCGHSGRWDSIDATCYRRLDIPKHHHNNNKKHIEIDWILEDNNSILVSIPCIFSHKPSIKF